VTLRPHPVVSSPGVEARALWPTAALGNELRAKKPLHPPLAMVERIRLFPHERCAELIDEGIAAIGYPVAWADGSVEALKRRSVRIQQLVEEVWAAA
jgi:hypothetical protein